MNKFQKNNKNNKKFFKKNNKNINIRKENKNFRFIF